MRGQYGDDGASRPGVGRGEGNGRRTVPVGDRKPLRTRHRSSPWSDTPPCRPGTLLSPDTTRTKGNGGEGPGGGEWGPSGDTYTVPCPRNFPSVLSQQEDLRRRDSPKEKMVRCVEDQTHGSHGQSRTLLGVGVGITPVHVTHGGPGPSLVGTHTHTHMSTPMCVRGPRSPVCSRNRRRP